MKTILLTGGGTGGHVLPNLALLPNLKKYFDKIYYIGSNGIEKTLLLSYPEIEYYEISTVKLQRKFTLKNLAIPFKLLRSINEAKKILKKLRPNVIFSKGGYVSLPVILAGAKLNIPCVTHESDLTLGLANKLMARYCDYVFTSFSTTAKTLKNGVFTGTPIRNSLFSADKKQALKFFGFSGKKPILLITGGSKGSVKLNELAKNSREILGKTFDIIHLTGKGNTDNFTAEYYFQAEFISRIELALTACDLAVTRGGANTLLELIALKKPSLIIPLPKTNSRGDQILNAEYFSSKGLSKTLPQENATKSSFIYNINALYRDYDEYKKRLNAYPVQSGNDKISELLNKISK